ncbi:myomegalin isoform X3 [Oryzias melastigma]|uniref:myomegalin isoform X3 n=1 Tax=Oryzias melastigma TaxID=30732 RepID=UPI000CF81FE7|nr:myomegalin isoform X3 [Oryzias melastigma]
MLDVLKMKESCRICGRELCGNQRRWIFHPGAKLNLQVLLSHALGRELTRDGRGEFACSKCAFMLDRMYRFDTVIARVEALSLERLQKLLLEKERLRQCIGGLYRRNNTEDGVGPPGSGADAGGDLSPVVDLSALHEGRYTDMVHEDLAYSVYESWAEKEDPAPDQRPLHQCPGADLKPRRCRGCAALRVADSDYEAVCKVPRRVGRRSTSCGPSTRYSATTGAEEPPRTSNMSESAKMETDKTTCDQRSPSPASSAEFLDSTVDGGYTSLKETEEQSPEEGTVRMDKPLNESILSGVEVMLGLLRGWEYRPVKPLRSSRLPVLVKASLSPHLTFSTHCELYPHLTVPEVVTPQDLQAELAEMEEQWEDEYIQCGPFRFQQHLVGEQQDQLSQYESAAGQCVAELATAQNQVCSLQAKIRESESRNQKLQERLAEMELELRSAREEAQQQERNTQNLSDVVNSKEAEAAELCRVIDEQNRMLCSLRELAGRNQLQQLQVSGAETGQGQGEVLALQASLFQAQLELQAGQRSHRQAARAQDDQSRALQRLENDLQGALLHKRETERHNQELQLALQKAQAALQEKEEQLRKRDQDRCQADVENERTIRELRTSLQTKEQLLEEYSEMLEDPKEQRDSLLQKLRQRIKERDRALEKAVDDRFRCVEEKEETARRLQLLVREKDRDLERQRCVLTNNEETIASLEMLVRGKTLQLEQVSDTWRSAQQQRQELEERQSCVLKERDGVIERLQTALQAVTQEAQGLRSSLLAQIHSTPGDITEELKLRLQLKDHLLQEVLADRTHQARQHEDDVQDLLRTINSKDQYIQESAAQLSQVIAEQTSRLQELRRQLGSGFGPSPDSEGDLGVDLQALKEELSLALRREKESEELSRSQAARIDSLCRTLHVKEEIIGDFQRQLADPSHLPLVEQLTQEVQELRESLVQLDSLSARGSVLASSGPTEFGELSSEGEDEADEGLNSEYTESVDEEEANLERCVGKASSSELQRGGEGLSVVKLLVEQKLQVERELGELKMQLEKTGFSSLSQIRKALINLQAENEDLKHQLQRDRRQNDEQRMLESEEEEEELDVTIEEDEEQAVSELWEAWDGELTMLQAKIQNNDELKKRRAKGLESLSLPTRCSQDLEAEQPGAMSEKRVRLQQRSKELQERLMVSEATVQAQAEQLKDYRELLTEAAVQQDSKQVQVDQQDLGYETCGRSENEAEREDASSPEFDDLEMCTSLDCHSQWWPSTGSSSTKAPSQSYGDEVSSLQRLVEDLRTQLSRSQAVIHGLQGRLRTLSTSSNLSTPRKVNWSFQASQSGAEEDEGWGSSDGGVQASPRHPHQEKGLRELMSRVDALEDQLRKDGRKSEEKRSSTWPGEFDTLIQAQARELSHLRQRLRDGRSVCSILTQHLGDTTKAFEELLRANDIDFYMGQSFREQLAQSSALAHRVATKISGRDLSEDPEEKTELLAIRLSKELQQKDKVIESLRAKLNQHHRSDTPCSSHALSDITDQSDRISYVSDEHGSTNEELDLGSDGASEPLQEEAQTSARVCTDCHSHDGIMSRHPSISSSILSSHRTQSCLSCPSLHCSSSPHKPTEGLSQAGFSTPQTKPLPGFPFAHQQPVDFLSLPYQGLQPSPFSSAASSSSLDASLAMKAGASLLESSALWGMAHGTRTARVAADLSSGSSGYQSGASHAGSDLMKEHLREIRSLRQRLEDSIQTNDRLRQQLEERLSRTASEKGAPTNIYIQGLDSVSQLSCQVGVLKEENISLQTQLKQATREGNKEVEQLREALLQEQSRLKEAELNAERWAVQSRKLQGEAEANVQEILELKQDQQQKQETINRLQHELIILQQQLIESSRLLHSLQSNGRLNPHPVNTHSAGEIRDSCQPGGSSTIFDPRDLHLQLEKQLSGQTGEQRGARRRLFQDNVVSPPVRDTGLCSPSSHLRLYRKEDESRTADLALASDGLHAIGRAADFKALQQLLLDGSALLLQMEAAICSLNASQEGHLHKPSDSGTVRRLLSDAQTLKEFLQDADALAQTFWTAASTETQESGQTRSLKEEVSSLRLQLSEREKALKDTTERLRSSDLTKDSMERFIVSQLSRTRDVLKQAKTNLQKNQLRISPLQHHSVLSIPSSTVTSPSSSSSSSSSSHPWLIEGKKAGSLHELGVSPGWSVMTTQSSSSTSAPRPAAHRPLHYHCPMRTVLL